MTMPTPGVRPERVADQIRVELGELLAREVKDPGVGFITITGVRVTADLQIARVYYSALGDAARRAEAARALARATPFLRRQIAARLRLRRAPELEFRPDDSLDRAERIEAILREIHGAAPEAPGDPEQSDE
jgi:ribosome-binding factor A